MPVTRRWLSAAYRGSVIAAMLAGMYFLTTDSGVMRGFEAWLAAHVVAAGASTTAGDYSSFGDVWFLLDANQATLQITTDCTASVLMIPFLAITGLLAWLNKKVSARPLIALAITLPCLIAINQFRILIIVWLMQALGPDPGFYWGHTITGSVVTIAGVAACFLIYISLVRKKTSPRVP